MEENNNSKLIAIVGANASGKSDMAVYLSRCFNGEIISADSRQIYKYMDIGSGKISGYPRNDIKKIIYFKKDIFYHSPIVYEGIMHWGIDLVGPEIEFTVAQYQAIAYNLIKEIINTGKIPFICGGTGLYIRAVLDGLQFPSVPRQEELRKALEKLTKKELQEKLLAIDPSSENFIDINNPRRLIRALEIVLSQDKSLSDLRRSAPVFFKSLTIGIKMDKDMLRQRIRKRLLERIELGMICEVEKLIKIGIKGERLESFGLEYRFIYRFLTGQLTYEQMYEQLYTSICRYAKRQYTWFNKYGNVKWITDKEEAKYLVENFLN